MIGFVILIAEKLEIVFSLKQMFGSDRIKSRDGAIPTGWDIDKENITRCVTSENLRERSSCIFRIGHDFTDYPDLELCGGVPCTLSSKSDMGACL